MGSTDVDGARARARSWANAQRRRWDLAIRVAPAALVIGIVLVVVPATRGLGAAIAVAGAATLAIAAGQLRTLRRIGELIDGPLHTTRVTARARLDTIYAGGSCYLRFGDTGDAIWSGSGLRARSDAADVLVGDGATHRIVVWPDRDAPLVVTLLPPNGREKTVERAFAKAARAGR